MKVPQDTPFLVELPDGKVVTLDGIDTSLQLASALTGASGDEDSLRRELAFWRQKLESAALSSTQALYVSREFAMFMSELKKNLPMPQSPKSQQPSDSSQPTPPIA